MNILLTGGAGFIGSHLCDFLIARGNSVICLDNLITGKMENINHLIDKSSFKFIKQDIAAYVTIDGPLDYVLHFASPASPVDYIKYPIQTLKVGSLGTHNALGIAKANGAKFLLASTSEIYGDPLVHPQREDYYGNVNAVGPRGVYDESKRFAEAITMAYHKVHGLDTKIARIFNTYGPRMRQSDGRAIPNFIAQAREGLPLTVYGKGDQTRSFCYIEDMIGGLYKLMASEVNEPVNLGNPDEVTILYLAEQIISLTKSKSAIEYKSLPEDDPKVRCPDIAKAKKFLKWEPKITLKDGLERTLMEKQRG